MPQVENYHDLLRKLRTKKRIYLTPGSERYEQIERERRRVFIRYQPIFSLAKIPLLSEADFVSFLYADNNRHWSGLCRSGLAASKNMSKVRWALDVLLDEGKAIETRFTESLNVVDGMGKGLATAILTVVYPEKYGVWNETSQKALKQEDVWPSFEYGEQKGNRYVRINDILRRLCSDLGIDLWLFDHLWCYILEGKAHR